MITLLGFVCPLVVQGLLPQSTYTGVDGSLAARSYRIYIQNSSPDFVWTSDIEIVMRERGDTFGAVHISIPPTRIPPESVGAHAVSLPFRADELDIRAMVGSVANCSGMSLSFARSRSTSTTYEHGLSAIHRRSSSPGQNLVDAY
jgi:hypothetical protein